MNNHNDNSIGAALLLLPIAFFGALVLWVIKVTGVPSEVALKAVVEFVVWCGLFGITLYVRISMRIEVVAFIYPALTAYLWKIITPFLDYWSKNLGARAFYQSEMAFYGEDWFQLSVFCLIFFGGYAILFFRMNHRRY
ncbi:hypothetical protein AB4233_02935 [Vibrio sp. 10N.286.45.F3]|uniref:hypothetical protein n=1 Tax=unclassified Vibrio TaxID=2614977 RepID=UPI000C851878|nr:hypothetical protein [Vibrio sp. 10N.261.45.A1]PML89277.1 hypothetical protein BCT66_07990 [Vibrio sp. 10N.261.49.E11]PMN80277.1 hypothetical protein BCT25_01805 [Vibrio sp. 10N.261.45.A6]PMN82205.1 hypothetical protein BCT22_13955 [Vibrio sp. 10N.261.45.A1]